MIKRFLLPLFLFSILILVSCRKDDVTFDYSIKGLADLKVKPGQTQLINLNIEKIQGATEPVTLTLDSVPEGVTYSLETEVLTPNPEMGTTLALSVSNQMKKMGNYKITLKATSPSCTKSIVFNISVDDILSMVVTVYDATQWTPERPAGELTSDATINIYNSEAAFLAKIPVYTAITGTDGKANFYHMLAGNYLFTVEKGNLSNIAEKKSIDGLLKGFVTTGIFQTKEEVYDSSQPTAQIGQLRYRDLNADGKITDGDRALHDMVTIYDDDVSEKVIWIGQ